MHSPCDRQRFASLPLESRPGQRRFREKGRSDAIQRAEGPFSEVQPVVGVVA
jgi:hypothetical protein